MRSTWPKPTGPGQLSQVIFPNFLGRVAPLGWFLLFIVFFCIYLHVQRPALKLDLEQYTNLVWADTWLVGCAGAFYGTTPQKTDGIIICNYGPGMGTTGSIYKIGEAGTACPAGTTKEADSGLCAWRIKSSIDFFYTRRIFVIFSSLKFN